MNRLSTKNVGSLAHGRGSTQILARRIGCIRITISGRRRGLRPTQVVRAGASVSRRVQSVAFAGLDAPVRTPATQPGPIRRTLARIAVQIFHLASACWATTSPAGRSVPRCCADGRGHRARGHGTRWNLCDPAVESADRARHILQSQLLPRPRGRADDRAQCHRRARHHVHHGVPRDRAGGEAMRAILRTADRGRGRCLGGRQCDGSAGRRRRPGRGGRGRGRRRA